MTIEIADRLIKLRKEHGYSQEELADKLGLSRQAVSKWERAEASPDTDNLICLAKLYGVSLDQLLSTDDDVETIVEEQVKRDSEVEEGVKKEKDTVVITDDEGNRAIIKDKEVIYEDSEGNRVNKKEKRYDKFISVVNVVEGILSIVALIAFILVGSIFHAWYWAWVFFFVPEIICSLLRAIHKKNAQHFNVSFLALFAFFFTCMAYPGLEAQLWHPMWIAFLLIPIYHMVVSMIRKIMRKEDDEEND